MQASTATRVALYARVSTTGHGQDIGLQVDELRLLAQQRGWSIVAEHLDDGVSGTKESRPALDQLMASVKGREVDVILVWKLDRLGRSLQHLLGLLQELAQHGVGFVSARDSGLDTTTAHGRLMFQLLGAFAEYERCLIQERVKAGVNRAKSQGKHCGRPRREVDVDMARMFLKQGHSIRRVAKMMGCPKSTLIRYVGESGT